MKVDGVKVPPPNERILKVVLSPEIGNITECTVLLSLISPRNSTGTHTHVSDEIMYVASGRGVGRVADEKMELREDMVVFAPKGVEHGIENTGDETLKLICFYTPPLKPAGYFETAIAKAKEYFMKLP
jgi:mannose-6-phosphate isomerase-like protein (cupin superfamily)